MIAPRSLRALVLLVLLALFFLFAVGFVPSRVRTGEADVRGPLSREVLRRVVRRHIPEIRACYEEGLESVPTLAGRVTILFVVDETGRVESAEIDSSTLRHGKVEECMLSAVWRWRFPAPDGGLVTVAYPFVLDPD